jgi:hypothetical protein
MVSFISTVDLNSHVVVKNDESKSIWSMIDHLHDKMYRYGNLCWKN